MKNDTLNFCDAHISEFRINLIMSLEFRIIYNADVNWIEHFFKVSSVARNFFIGDPRSFLFFYPSFLNFRSKGM